jgi:hypothetical protein
MTLRTIALFFIITSSFIFPATPQTPAVPNPQPGPAPTTPLNFIPIINPTICASPPGNVATDGCDDVCILVGCCNGWTSEQSGSVTLQNGDNIPCSSVNCGNVCRMACDRDPTPEGCNKLCRDTTSHGRAYIFSRPGFCEPPIIDPHSPTHIAFGFEVSHDVFLFGSVENHGGSPIVLPTFDNGFWMTTGSRAEMFATMANPSGSGFDGTQSVPPYNEYRMSAVRHPLVCAATRFAENLYSVGYNVIGNSLYSVCSKLTLC